MKGLTLTLLGAFLMNMVFTQLVEARSNCPQDGTREQNEMLMEFPSNPSEATDMQQICMNQFLRSQGYGYVDLKSSRGLDLIAIFKQGAAKAVLSGADQYE